MPASEAISESKSVQTATKYPFRLGVGAAHLGHRHGTLLLGENIGHLALCSNAGAEKRLTVVEIESSGRTISLNELKNRETESSDDPA